MKRTAIFTVCALALGGCAMSSGVLPMGPDTYSISASAAPVRGGTTGARQVALSEAGKYCAAQGKQILVTNTDSGNTNAYGAGKVDVIFQCIAADASARPTYSTPPSVLIQDQRPK